MNKRVIFGMLIVVFMQSSCESQKLTNKLPLKDFKFESIFGTTSKEPQNTYCMLGTGFFRAPRSENSDSLINQWIKSHPNAYVVSVSSFGHGEENPDSKTTYCWIIDNNDTINNFLVKNGCFPGGTMMRPKRWKEMDRNEKEIYKDSGGKINFNVHIDKLAYDKFIEQIKAAELYARNNKLGIWANETDE